MYTSSPPPRKRFLLLGSTMIAVDTISSIISKLGPEKNQYCIEVFTTTSSFQFYFDYSVDNLEGFSLEGERANYLASLTEELNA